MLRAECGSDFIQRLVSHARMPLTDLLTQLERHGMTLAAQLGSVNGRPEDTAEPAGLVQFLKSSTDMQLISTPC